VAVVICAHRANRLQPSGISMSRVNIQFTLFSAFYTPLIITMAGGFLKREGLEYDWTVASPGQSALRALETGDAHVVQSAPSQGFSAPAKTGDDGIVHFAQVNEMDGFFLTAREKDNDFSWQKLVGSDVIVFGSGQPNAMFRFACHKAGIDYDTLNIMTPGGAADIDKAFRDGQGTYVQQQGPFPQQLERDAVGHIVAAVGPLIGPNAFSSLAATRGWLGTDMAVAFTRAYTAARLYINEASAEDIAEAQSDFFPDIDKAAMVSCIDAYQKLGCWTPHVDITPAALEVTQDVFEFAGSLKTRCAYDTVCVSPPSV